MRGVRAVIPCLLAALALPGAVALAGFSSHIRRDHVGQTRTDSSGSTRVGVPLGTSLNPGGATRAGERQF
jgi:polysaccharide export outer membrane protein